MDELALIRSQDQRATTMIQHASIRFVCSLTLAGLVVASANLGFCQDFALKDLVLRTTNSGAQHTGHYTYQASFAAQQTKKLKVTLIGADPSAAQELANQVLSSLTTTGLPASTATAPPTAVNTKTHVLLTIEMENTTNGPLTAGLGYSVSEKEWFVSYKLFET